MLEEVLFAIDDVLQLLHLFLYDGALSILLVLHVLNDLCKDKLFRAGSFHVPFQLVVPIL